jgi:hypothetical protein
MLPPATATPQAKSLSVRKKRPLQPAAPTAESATPPAGAVYTNTVRIGYARISTRTQDHQSQLDALAAANCREVIVETASTRAARPKLAATLKPGDTLVIYKPDRVARSMKELLVLLEDELHARGVNLEILNGICAGLHKPNGQTIADKMLFMVAAMAAEMERDLIQDAPSTAWPRQPPRAAEADGPSPLTRTPSPSPVHVRLAMSPSPPSPPTWASADPPSTGPSPTQQPETPRHVRDTGLRPLRRCPTATRTAAADAAHPPPCSLSVKTCLRYAPRGMIASRVSRSARPETQMFERDGAPGRFKARWETGYGPAERGAGVPWPDSGFGRPV